LENLFLRFKITQPDFLKGERGSPFNVSPS